MTHTEFWAVMELVFPDGRARSLAQDEVLPDLGSLTADEALSAGIDPLQVWKSIIALMELPAHYEYLHRMNTSGNHA